MEMKAIDPALIISASLFWVLMWGYFGYKYWDQRIWWAWADTAMLLVSTITVITLAYYSIPEDFAVGGEEAAHSVERLIRSELHRSTSNLQDKFCKNKSTAKATYLTNTNINKPICDFANNVARELVMPNLNNINSGRLGNEDSSLCNKPCKQDLTNVIEKLTRYSNFYTDRRDQRTNSSCSVRGQQLIWKILFVSFFLFAFGPRLGRSVAELRRVGAFNLLADGLNKVLKRFVAHNRGKD